MFPFTLLKIRREKPESQPSFVSLVPVVLFSHICQFLSFTDLQKAERVNKTWSHLLTSPALEQTWKFAYGQNWCLKEVSSQYLSPHGDKTAWRVRVARRISLENNWTFGRATQLQLHDRFVLYSLSLSDDMLVTGGDDYKVKMWDLARGKLITEMVGHTDVIRTVQMKKGVILSGACDNLVKVWNSQTQMCTANLSGHTRSLLSLSFQGTEFFFSGSSDNSLKEWDLTTQTCLRTYSEHSRGVKAVSYDNNHLIVTGSYDRTIKIWDRTNGSCISTLSCHSATVNSIFLNKHYLVSGSDDRTIVIYDPRKLSNFKHQLNGHTGWIRSISVNGNHVISGSYDDTIKIWDLEQGKCLNTFNDHHQGIEAVDTDLFRLVSGDISGKCIVGDFRFPLTTSEGIFLKRISLKRKMGK